MNEESNVKTLDRRTLAVSEEEFERLAKRAAEIVMDQVAIRLGKGVLRITAYLISVAAAVAWAALTAHDKLPK